MLPASLASPLIRSLLRLSLCATVLVLAPLMQPAFAATDTPARPAITQAPPAKTYAFPALPADKTAGLEGAYLRVVSTFWNGRISLTNEGWFFTKNGRFSRTPAGGFDPLAFAETTTARKQDGIYWIEEGKLVLRWAKGGKDTTYDFSRDNDRIKIGGLVATPAEGFSPGWRAEVSYEGGGSAGGGGASVSSANTLHLHADGTFGASATAAANTDSPTVSAAASAISGGDGTYEFSGYTLTLRHADGREEHRTVFSQGERDTSGAPAHLWREGSLLRRRD